MDIQPGVNENMKITKTFFKELWRSSLNINLCVVVFFYCLGAFY